MFVAITTGMIDGNAKLKHQLGLSFHNNQVPLTQCSFSCNDACNNYRNRIEFYFCDIAHNKLHHVTPPKNLFAHDIPRKVACVSGH